MRTGMWCLRGDNLVSALQHAKLEEEQDCDKKRLACEMNRKLSVGKRPISSTLNNSSGQFLTTAPPPPPAPASRSLNVSDANECHLGNMVISSYCCVILVIFALLFILIGSILTYAVTQYSNAEVVQFFNKYEYLRVASPLMICLGLLMFIPGIIFWIVKRWCRRPRSNDFVNSSYTNSFFPPDVAHPSSHSSQGSLMALTSAHGVARPRNSLASTISSRTVSPLLQPLSGDGSESKGEWKWPITQNTQLMPPAGSFPSSPKLNVLSPVTAEPTVDIISESNVDEVLEVTYVSGGNGGGDDGKV